jgi:hypothetical protein
VDRRADLHQLPFDLKAWIDMNRRELLAFLLGGKVDEAAIAQLEPVCEVTAQQYESFGPRAVAAIRRGQAELVETLLPDCPSKLKPRLHAVRASHWPA